MSHSYTCPECKATLKTPARIAAGKVVTCPKCDAKFTPEPKSEEPAAGTLKFADDDVPKKAAAPTKPGAKAKPAPESPKAAPPAGTKPYADDDDESAESVKAGYGVVKETEEELKEAEKNKPGFNEVQDKFKKSARGPAQGLLVMPSRLLIGEGLLVIVAGILIFLQGMWPLVFNDAAPGEEELEEAVRDMLLGSIAFFWGSCICFGASQMQELGSFPLAMTGAVMGVVPGLVGIFGIVMLQNPKVKAGFAESEDGPDDDDDDEDGEKAEDDDEDETDDEDEDDEEEEEEEKPRKKAKAKAAKKRKDDEDDE